jgi:Na+/H+-dicarboxylate symporter
MRKIGLTGWIFLAMVAGIATGLGVHQLSGPTAAQKFAAATAEITSIFLRLIKMIIAPLVFTTLVPGIAKLGDIRSVGRIGVKTLLWFLGASLLSLLVGLTVMNLLGLGRNLHLPVPAEANNSSLPKEGISFSHFITHLFPTSFFDAMAQNEILQIVVFALLFGIATAAVGEKGKVIIRVLDALAEIVLKITGYVMRVAPLAAFAAMASILAIRGVQVLSAYSRFIGVFYLSTLGLWVLLAGAGWLILGRSVFHLLGRVKDGILLAFSTASSEAAFPRLIPELESFGCPPRIVTFVLPLGYSFNLDGSMLYMTFASLFIAQAYNIPLGIGQQVSMLLVLLLTSKGIAGVPRASLVVIAATLSMFNIPQQGLLLLLGIDQIMDMARSATNVVGNSIATAVISKWEHAKDFGAYTPELTQGAGVGNFP